MAAYRRSSIDSPGLADGLLALAPGLELRISSAVAGVISSSICRPLTRVTLPKLIRLASSEALKTVVSSSRERLPPYPSP